jgi:nucleoside-diphosphate-sugar epimerase
MPGITMENHKKYFLTGATGFLGSHIMAGLLLTGKGIVIAGRASSGESLRERIRRLLKWFGIIRLEPLLEYYETDFLKSRLGVRENEYRNLCNRDFSIIHCASDTSFAEKNRARVIRSNVESLTEILNFAHESRTHCFHFISTAYAVGADRIECPEAQINTSRFTNVYEESKARAESIVSGRCGEVEIPYTIIRPSIVYGNSVTGRSLKFNALYYPIRSLQIIRDIYLEDIRNNNGIKSAECGVYISNQGALHLPIKIFIPNEGRINLIPVDYFTDTIISIIDKPVSGTIYHITSINPESISRLVSYTERFLNITGIDVVIGKSSADELRNPPEELFDHFIKIYRPYLSDTRIFQRENTDMTTGGVLPPGLDYEIFQKCMAFATSVDWGKTLFQ